ncbi:tyrosine-type recombinase/integrase [Escherichia coli]|uniref:Site specific recombinase n=1 Tax=Escherichia coli TaxID=562 RepID=A0A170TW17_ECOLX|nr:tyrosine-type DNA invertase [Escherichia coli]EGM3814783.1 tyrosine-type recombinase/integrase [Escherichia coli]EMW91576.1 phage integrase family protein [Escherichia coli 180050]EMW93147.1 phage integrase family protein [Escherichia coli 180050]EMW93150.1 phage integrase family protein [Escherichia coli 180050]OKV90023.1 transcriptional regulator [Escherichia coli]
MKRKYLSEKEVHCLLKAAAENQYSVRDYCMISMAFIHGLRVSELVNLKVDDYDSLSAQLNIKRLKNGFCTIQPLLPDENELLQCWLDERKTWDGHESCWLFLSKNGGPLSRQRFWQLLRKYGDEAHLTIKVHPHMLRHACGFNLAERGNDTRLIQDYLGHRNIRHTVHYTASNPERFRNAWTKNNFHSFSCTHALMHSCI